MEHNTAEGVRSLYRTLSHGNTNTALFDADNESFRTFIASAAYLTTDSLRDTATSLDGGATRRQRSRVRYLAVVLPGKTLHEVAADIHYVLDNGHLSIGEVRDILRGSQHDLPLEKIQKIGQFLASGESLRGTARKVEVAYGTVEAIESFLGIAEQYRLKLVDAACDAVRDRLSTRQFAARSSIPKSNAHVLMVQARQVLRELGEQA